MTLLQFLTALSPVLFGLVVALMIGIIALRPNGRRAR